MEARIYTAQEAGEILGVTSQGIRKYCARNDVPRAGRTWQISESVLAQMRVYYHATDAPDETNHEKQEQPEKQTNETTVEPFIPERDTLKEDNARLQEQVKALSAQLEAKERQIESLTDALSKSIEQNSVLVESMAETAKALSASKALDSVASQTLVPADNQSADLSHYSFLDVPQKQGFWQRLKWLLRGK